jgi:dTDP-4-amino-4,6-dideoxygalactose transaminase
MATIDPHFASSETPLPFSRPVVLQESIDAVTQFLSSSPKAFNGNGPYTKECQKVLEEIGYKNPLLTSSCTSALEIAALCLKEHLDTNNDQRNEVICPSFTFVSSTNSFAKFGFKLRYVDINKDTLNSDKEAIEAAFTPNVAAVVVVHYGGISADVMHIKAFCQDKGLILIEDAAQTIGTKCHGQLLGTFGDIGCLSFHDTKNCTSGEGGAILINNEAFLQTAKIAREKGTNREQFLQGQVDKYTWVGLGGHYLMSEINAIYLKPQLQQIDRINNHRLTLWNLYQENLMPLENTLGQEIFTCSKAPPYNDHNGHIYYIKLKNNEERVKLRDALRTIGIESTFHYSPLHLSPHGIATGTFIGNDHNTITEPARILRLPLFYSMTKEDVVRVCEAIKSYFN